MKIIYKLLFLFLLTIGYSSCDFLDIVPDEITTEADAFTPDEECGSGAAHFDFEAFDAEVAYTMDGDGEGEIQYQNFNACEAKFESNGKNVHPGSAKNVMINAVLIAADINNMLPRYEIPRYTEEYEGFYHLLSIHGDEGYAIAEYIIRDHDTISRKP